MPRSDAAITAITAIGGQYQVLHTERFDTPWGPIEAEYGVVCLDSSCCGEGGAVFARVRGAPKDTAAREDIAARVRSRGPWGRPMGNWGQVTFAIAAAGDVMGDTLASENAPVEK